MKRILSVLILLLATSAFAVDRVTYDNQCLTIDGKDTFIFSGAFHYFRCPKELWHDRFAKMKAAGCNAVETYVAWNFDEREKPANVDDYSKVDLSDLEDFLKMAEDEFGLYVIVRPGPYICAEWDNGGYPRWLLPMKPSDFNDKTWLRGDEPSYLAWCKHWYTAVAKVAVPHLITHRPPGRTGIILWQIENEYDYAGQSEQVKRNQLSALAHDSRDLGVDVPLFTCQTRGFKFNDDPYIQANVFDTDNSYPKYDMNGHRKGIESVQKYQPDKFTQITEQQGGWFGQVGGKLAAEQGFDDHQINMVTLVSMASGATSMNYYMFFGGTNFGDWAGRNITTSYDYDAPIREWGGVDKRYAAVQAIGLMLQEHGTKLARAVLDKTQILESSDKDVRFVVRRATDGSKYIFVSTEQRREPRKGTAKLQFENGDETVVEYSLDPFGAKILYMPTDSPPVWLPKPAPPIDRPTDLPSPVTISEALRKDDPGPTSWKTFQAGQMIEDLGIYDSRFVFYHSKLAKGDAKIPDAGINLWPKFSHLDEVVENLGGQVITKQGEPIHVDTAQLDAGLDITLLYENTGHENGGLGMETKRGLASWITTVSGAPHQTIAGWRMKRIARMNDKTVIGADVDDSGWESVDVSKDADTLTPNQIAAYRANFEVSDAQLKDRQTLLRIGRIDDQGAVYINGKKIADTNDWSQVFTFDIGSEIHTGKNNITVIVHNVGGGGGLGQGVSLEPIADTSIVNSTMEYSDTSVGTSEKWWNPSLDDSAWEKVSLNGETAASQLKSMLTWYRVKFEIPDAKPGVWVPWKIRLDATGNGFIYLNDHPLGRYWQVGPQREYFLPECWLKTGKGQTNVVTLCLRPTSEGTRLNKAEVSPYSEWAEKR